MIDIYSKADYPANEFSNFTAHEFIIDGVKCASMEGFLQSLKIKDIVKQTHICSFVGKDAKKALENSFDNFRWKITKTLYWRGEKINRFSDDYKRLLDKAYFELGKNEDFKKALLETGNDELSHTIGKNDMRKTILTEYEFVCRLLILRSIYLKEMENTNR